LLGGEFGGDFGMMNKRSLLLLLVVCLLACLPAVGFAEEIRLQPGKECFSLEVLGKLSRQFPEEKSLAADLEALMASYPGFCLGVESGPGKRLYLVMKNGVKLIYADGRAKDFQEKLNKPDLKDMLSQLYRPGAGGEPFRPDYDPGRFRVNALFNAVYGASSREVQANMVPVSFCGARVMFNAQNGAAQALKRVGQELAALVAKRPQLRQYLFPLGGTFNWRHIAGTSRLSPHSWGIALDLNPRKGAYWRGRKLGGAGVERLRHNYPPEIVELFEKHGFIWGGKWSHFDLMHFEYRPELLRKWQLSRPGSSLNSSALSLPGAGVRY
jgi:hypothetical protein